MTCQTCHGTGELVAVGNGRTIRLDEWNGDEGDLVDCPECKGEPMTIKDAEPQGAIEDEPDVVIVGTLDDQELLAMWTKTCHHLTNISTKTSTGYPPGSLFTDEETKEIELFAGNSNVLQTEILRRMDSARLAAHDQSDPSEGEG